MTTQQTNENIIIAQIRYELEQQTIHLKQQIIRTKNEVTTNKIKQHQALLNLEYAHEIILRSITTLREAENK